MGGRQTNRWRKTEIRASATSTKGALTSVELFAGAGGSALGLHRAGFKPLLVTDWDEGACETLRKNAEPPRLHTSGWPIKRKDVRSIRFTGLPPVDLLCAGAPCQPFSYAGLLLGEDDHRNMFGEVLRAVRQLKPRAFLIENVRGLLFKRSLPYFDYLMAQLRVPSLQARGRDKAGHLAALSRVSREGVEYQVDWRLLNAADFGLPQHRVRLVIVGLRADQRPWTWPEKTHSRDALIAALRADDYWDHYGVPERTRRKVRKQLLTKNLRPEGERWSTLRDVLHRLGEPSLHSNGDSSHVLVRGARLYPGHTGSSLDWPAKSVKAGVHGSPGGEHILLRDTGTFRYLTVRECAVLQGFPADYALPALRSHAMRHLGNAVPIELAEALGKQLANVLGASNGAGKPSR